MQAEVRALRAELQAADRRGRAAGPEQASAADAHARTAAQVRALFSENVVRSEERGLMAGPVRWACERASFGHGCGQAVKEVGPVIAQVAALQQRVRWLEAALAAEQLDGGLAAAEAGATREQLGELRARLLDLGTRAEADAVLSAEDALMGAAAMADIEAAYALLQVRGGLFWQRLHAWPFLKQCMPGA
jgi:hypothetical protein